eukprot:108787-Amorphochlora_amoeboformis.AAC.1
MKGWKSYSYIGYVSTLKYNYVVWSVVTFVVLASGTVLVVWAMASMGHFCGHKTHNTGRVELTR